MMKTSGFDWLFISIEHGPMSIEFATTIAVAALDTGISPIVRVPFMQHTMATRVLDAGALVTASARRDLQHAAPEEGVVKRQKDNRADRGDARTVNAVDVEAAHPGAAKKVGKPAADNRTNDAKQDVDDGALARGADNPARDQAKCEPQQNPHDHRVSSHVPRANGPIEYPTVPRSTSVSSWPQSSPVRHALPLT
jgi:hypothetical protein